MTQTSKTQTLTPLLESLQQTSIIVCSGVLSKSINSILSILCYDLLKYTICCVTNFKHCQSTEVQLPSTCLHIPQTGLLQVPLIKASQRLPLWNFYCTCSYPVLRFELNFLYQVLFVPHILLCGKVNPEQLNQSMHKTKEKHRLQCNTVT